MMLSLFVNTIKLKDLLASELINNPSKEPDTLYQQYHTTLSTLIDTPAPLHTKHTKVTYILGWVNETVFAVKETMRLFEHIWQRNKSTFSRSQYLQKFNCPTESACRPNLNSLNKKFRIITTTHENHGVSWVMCYTDFQPRSSHQ